MQHNWWIYLENTDEAPSAPDTHSHWPCVTGEPCAHHMLVAWQRQDGFCLQKHAYICSFSYNFSCHVAEDIRDVTRGTDCLQLHAQQRTRSYNKKIWMWFLISIRQVSSLWPTSRNHERAREPHRYHTLCWPGVTLRTRIHLLFKGKFKAKQERKGTEKDKLFITQFLIKGIQLCGVLLRFLTNGLFLAFSFRF